MVNPKQARLTLGLTQTQMAKAMGVSRGSWLKWEREEQGITAAPSRLLETLLWLDFQNLLPRYIKRFSK